MLLRFYNDDSPLIDHNKQKQKPDRQNTSEIEDLPESEEVKAVENNN
jgi:hypothetical protein